MCEKKIYCNRTQNNMLFGDNLKKNKQIYDNRVLGTPVKLNISKKILLRKIGRN